MGFLSANWLWIVLIGAMVLMQAPVGRVAWVRPDSARLIRLTPQEISGRRLPSSLRRPI